MSSDDDSEEYDSEEVDESGEFSAEGSEEEGSEEEGSEEEGSEEEGSEEEGSGDDGEESNEEEEEGSEEGSENEEEEDDDESEEGEEDEEVGNNYATTDSEDVSIATDGSEEVADEDNEEASDDDDDAAAAMVPYEEKETDDDDEDDDDEDDSDDDEDEDEESDEEFEDEPQTKAVPGGSDDDDDSDDDDEDEAVPEDEPEYDADKPRAYDEEDRRNKMAALLCCLCCCCIIILVILLVVLLGGKDDDGNDKSTEEIVPSPAPSVSDEPVIFPAVSDTYLRGGPDADTSFGTSQTFEVQNSGTADGDVAYSLLQFDLVGLPPENEDRDREIILQLSHVASAVSKNQDITVVKLPNDPAVDVEALTWNSYTAPTEGIMDGPTFQVTETATTVDIDITSLVDESSSSAARNLLRGGQGRELQQPERIFLMLESRSSDEEVGSVFRSREFQDEDLRPKIIHNFVTALPPSEVAPTTPEPAGLPTVSPAPTVTASPSTPPPTLSPKPTSSKPSSGPTTSVAPTVSPAPSNLPSLSTAPSPRPSVSASNAPSTSANPTNVPTSSPMPTVSPAPSDTPTTSPAPTISNQPSTSSKPTSCQEYIDPYLLPNLYDIRGATDNPYPDGALTYTAQTGRRVTVRVTQLWSTDTNLVWLAPLYFEMQEWKCPKIRNIAPGTTLEYDLPCFNGVADFVIIVNDPSLNGGLDLILPEGCQEDADDETGFKVLYAFTAGCDPPPKECDETVA